MQGHLYLVFLAEASIGVGEHLDQLQVWTFLVGVAIMVGGNTNGMIRGSGKGGALLPPSTGSCSLVGGCC